MKKAITPGIHILIHNNFTSNAMTDAIPRFAKGYDILLVES